MHCLSRSRVVTPGLPARERGTAHANVGLPSPPAAAFPHILPTPPISLDECFFLNSLVVRFPYSLIFWQFSFFVVVVVIVFKCGVVLLLVV